MRHSLFVVNHLFLSIMSHSIAPKMRRVRAARMCEYISGYVRSTFGAASMSDCNRKVRAISAAEIMGSPIFRILIDILLGALGRNLGFENFLFICIFLR